MANEISLKVFHFVFKVIFSHQKHFFSSLPASKPFLSEQHQPYSPETAGPERIEYFETAEQRQQLYQILFRHKKPVHKHRSPYQHEARVQCQLYS